MENTNENLAAAATDEMIVGLIAKKLGLRERQVAGTVNLLKGGATIPFISRYRKETTGGLNEVQIAEINDSCEKLEELAHRREYILGSLAGRQIIVNSCEPELYRMSEKCGLIRVEGGKIINQT